MAHYSKWLHYTTDRESGFERVRADIAQTSFFEGREFRAFYELSLAAGASRTFKFSCPVEFVLFGQDLNVTSGKLRYESWVGPTESTPFNTTVTQIGKNRMLERRFPYYVTQAVITTGGTITDGTMTDVDEVDTSNQSGNKGISLGPGDERGLPAGTYYIKISNPGASTSTGFYRLWWEERGRHPDWKVVPQA